MPICNTETVTHFNSFLYSVRAHSTATGANCRDITNNKRKKQYRDTGQIHTQDILLNSGCKAGIRTCVTTMDVTKCPNYPLSKLTRR
jgi:hypothetical protein